MCFKKKHITFLYSEKLMVSKIKSIDTVKTAIVEFDIILKSKDCYNDLRVCTG